MAIGHSRPSPAKPRIASTMGKARIFHEAMSFIKEYRGKTIVIKYGGSAMLDEHLRSTFADDVALLNLVGIEIVIVHGGGPQISAAMERAGIEPRFVGGLRVTDAETLRVVQSTLVGEINPSIVQLINGHGSVATGVSGLDGNLFEARQRDPELGFVGEITKVNTGLLDGLRAQGYVTVVAPVARGDDGQVYNVNADTAAGALAVALGAEKLVFLTDVEGLYRDLGDDDSLISTITAAELRSVMESGAASAGMLPKLEACVTALDSGVSKAHILDGRIQHSLLLEIFTPEGIGTMVTKKAKEVDG